MCTFSYQSQNFSGDNLSGFVTREETQRTPFGMMPGIGVLFW
jgi:hypothetical protein